MTSDGFSNVGERQRDDSSDKLTAGEREAAGEEWHRCRHRDRASAVRLRWESVTSWITLTQFEVFLNCLFVHPITQRLVQTLNASVGLPLQPTRLFTVAWGKRCC